MAGVTITFDLTEFRTKLAVLKRPQAPVVRALNRSIDSGNTLAVRLITQDTGLKRDVVQPLMKVSYASATDLTATLEASPQRIPLINFGAKGPEPSRGRPPGVRAKLKGGAGLYPHAFIAKVYGPLPSGVVSPGHRGVFERMGKTRKPIRQLRGPSIWHVFEKYAAAAHARALEQLGKNVEHEIAFALSR